MNAQASSDETASAGFKKTSGSAAGKSPAAEAIGFRPAQYRNQTGQQTGWVGYGKLRKVMEGYGNFPTPAAAAGQTQSNHCFIQIVKLKAGR
jgi:hypothetical protein